MMVAEALGKFEHEVLEQLTMEELERWGAYFILRDEAIKKASKKGKGK